jgi:CYTH domain-containing protein
MAGDGLEIERKFLLAEPPTASTLSGFGEPVHMEQRYLVTPREGLTRRVRSMTTSGGSRYVYTEKEAVPGVVDGRMTGAGAVVRAEREAEVSDERYEELVGEADPAYRVVVKDRWKIPVGDLVYELDHVTAPVELWVLEVELDDADVAVDVPAVFGDVREDPFCSMAALARGEYPPGD